jgi:hypothetical protein
MLRLRYIPIAATLYQHKYSDHRLLNIREKEWLRKVRYLCEQTQASLHFDSTNKDLIWLSECSASWYNENLQMLTSPSHN